MVNSIVVYPSYIDERASVIDEFEEVLTCKTLSCYASLLVQNGLQDGSGLEHALYNSINVLNAAQVPVRNHFRKVFICTGNEIKTDWLVSKLGFKLIIMHADETNPVIARLQVSMLTNKNENDGNFY